MHPACFAPAPQQQAVSWRGVNSVKDASTSFFSRTPARPSQQTLVNCFPLYSNLRHQRLQLFFCVCGRRPGEPAAGRDDPGYRNHASGRFCLITGLFHRHRRRGGVKSHNDFPFFFPHAHPAFPRLPDARAGHILFYYKTAALRVNMLSLPIDFFHYLILSPASAYAKIHRGCNCLEVI